MTRGSRRLALLFLAVVVPSAAGLVSLGWRAIQQDRELWLKHETERRVTAANEVARALDVSLTTVVDGEGSANAVVFPSWPSRAGMQGRILWRAKGTVQLPTDAPAFVEGEALEYGGRIADALERYRALTHEADGAIKAGAWLRIGGIHAQRREWNAALAAYRELSKIEHVAVNDTPASLLARRGICSVLAAAGRSGELAEETASLEADFLKGTWELEPRVWQIARRDLERWSGRALGIPHAARVLTAAADVMAEARRQPQPGVHRSLITVEGVDVTVVERLDERGHRVALLLPDALKESIDKLDVNGIVTLLTPSGSPLVGARPLLDETHTAKSTLINADLPWAVYVTGNSAGGAEEFAARRSLLLWALLMLVSLLAGGSYLLWRVVQRELAVARLQTEFVATVSHEFRTPLASLRHVTELLQEDDELPACGRQVFYEALGRNTERLSRLVESLLDFSRIEGGRKPYDLRRIDARAIVSSVVRDFQTEVRQHGFDVELIADERDLTVKADIEALSHALRNLLDNAMKYSGDGRLITVFLRARQRDVVLAVKDRGLGIPPNERTEIFRRFVRGSKARELGIKGTGLGLAMVTHIVEAHRGRVEVDSTEGMGSTFRVVLPAA